MKSKKAWCYKCNKSTDFSLWKLDVKVNALVTGGPERYICPVCQNTITPKIEQ